MINCSDNTYYIYYTDAVTGAIAIPITKSSLIQTGDVIAVRNDNSIEYGKSITLVGKTRLEYGEVFNENMLHLLEHFASPSANALTPSQLEVYRNLLEHPVVGQLWYNSSFKTLNVCVSANPILWNAITDFSSVAGNSGILSDGEYIPLPVSVDGYEFVQSECAWHVSPYFASPDAQVEGIDISADDRLVRCRYTTASGEVTGLVNYIILGIKGYEAPVQYVVECPEPSPTPTASVTPSLGASPTPTRTPTPTPTFSGEMTVAQGPVA